jgi:CRISPR-associated protein Csm4
MLHSDALTAAIYFMWSRLGKEEWIPKDQLTDPGFVISSMFPYSVIDGKYTYFVPKPFLPGRSVDVVLDTVLRKKLKKVRWIDWPIFSALLNGETLKVGSTNVFDSYQSIDPISEMAGSSRGAKGAHVESEVFPRARVSRTGLDDTVIYYIERLFFGESSGLYSVIYYSSEEAKSRVWAALRLLGDEGIGTDRNVGHGKFVAEAGDTLVLPEIESPAYLVNLGLFCPSGSDELSAMIRWNNAGYDIVRRTGWLSEPYNTWRKKSVYMFREGSCFDASWLKDSSQPLILGTNIDVRPQETVPAISHPVWRAGRSIFVFGK